MGNEEQPRVPAGSPEGGQWTQVNQITQSRSEAIEMSKNLTAQLHQPHHVVDFVKAIPRRFAVVDLKTHAEKYAGKDWAPTIFSVKP